MKSIQRWHVGVAGVLLALCGSAVAVDSRGVDQPEVRRDGNGAKRDKLNASELKAFDIATLSTVDSWQGGAAPTAETLKDKVVALVTWANWRESSVRAVQQLAKLQATNPDLVVIAVHDAQNWDDAKKTIEEWSAGGAKVLVGHDAGSKFRAAVMSEQNPDVYMVDRAGQLRFADIELGSVEKAATMLLKETAEEAKGRNGVLADAQKKNREDSLKTGDVKGVRRAGEKLAVDFKMPETSAYEKLLWPKGNDKNTVSSFATDIQGQKFPVEFGKDEVWLTERPDTKGKLIIVDFWATWCGPCMKSKPVLEYIATKHRDEVSIIGISGYAEKKIDVERYLREHETEVAQAWDTEKKIQDQLGVQAFPTVFIMSSDGVVRWIGHPMQDEFQAVIDTILERDPGVKARREAVAKVLKTRGA
ncbi:hypothetical protein BH11PLA1_BH11PLA1_12820 [soil metagenome]